VACTSVGASVTHECALKTREPNFVPRAAKSFFIPVVYSAPEAVGHVAPSELTSTRRQAPELRDMWQRRSSPQQGAEVRGCVTCGSTAAHLVKEVRSGDEGHVVVPELTSVRTRGPGT
jgi:hypothetical protein